MSSNRRLFLEIGLAAGMILGVILFGAVYPWISMALYALLFFLFLIYPGALLAVSDFPPLFRTGMSFILLFVSCQFLFVSLNRYQTGEELLKWLALVAVFLLGQLLSVDQIKRILKILVILGIWEILYGTIQLSSSPEMILWRTKTDYFGCLTGTYINRNHLAGLLEVCSGIQLGFLVDALYRKKARETLGQAVVFWIFMLGLIKTGSRMGVASFFVAFLLFVPVLLRKFTKGRKVAILVSIGMAMAAALWVSGRIFFGRFADLENTLTMGEGRWLVWLDALRMFRDHFWFGVGLGGFKWIYPSYQSQVLLLGWPHAHNDYLELLVELGILGFSALCVSFVALGTSAVKEWLRKASDDFFILGGLLVAVSAFFIHGLADFNWAIPANNMIVVMVLGFVIRLLTLSKACRRDA